MIVSKKEIMGCGGAKSINTAEANKVSEPPTQSQTQRQVPRNKIGKLADPVLRALSDIFAEFAQIDPHRKKPIPKMAAIKAKEKQHGV
jgi:hypothetical protein